ncbi:MAG: sulfatase/phosphatase domain-containing protein, partial [Planctomycetota bacterium]|nr:sulfatase/phosphatase domain-containing protein [Planctomycetota bacterium]
LVRSNESLRNNTLVLICSDNGPEKGAGSAGPYRGFKTHLFVGGIRSPQIAWGPGLIRQGRTGRVNASSVFSAIDLAPSLLKIAGVEFPANIDFDGEALPRVLLGTSRSSRAAPIFFRRPPDRDSFYGVADLPDLAVRDGRWKLLCEYDGSNPLLYDLALDASEAKNLARDEPEVVTRLSQSLIAWHKSMPPDNGATFQPQRRKPPVKKASP